MKRVLVIGDTMCDIYVRGRVNRMSPEDSSVPVLDFDNEHKYLGGAANVAVNLRTLSKNSVLIDYFGFLSYDLLTLFNDYEIGAFGSILTSDQIIRKTRLLNKNKQLLRLDNIKKYKNDDCERLSYSNINYEKYDLICVSDYDKGTLNPIWNKLLPLNVPKVVDIKRYRSHVPKQVGENTIIKCNEIEYEENKNSFENMTPSVLVVTRSNKGYAIKSSNEDRWFYSDHNENTQPASVIGAGDVFLAAMGVNFLEKERFDVRSMCRFANKCSSVHVTSFKQTLDRREVDE